MTGARLVDDGIVVRQVRCRSRAEARLRVTAALGRLQDDTGLPRTSILAVRSLVGTVAGDPPRVGGVDLRAVAARAQRASVGPVPPDCDAVVFADEAELLASLCGDVVAGRQLGWWWAALLGSAAGAPLPRGATVAAALERWARALPAVASMAPVPLTAALGLVPVPDGLRLLGLAADAHARSALVEVVRQAWQAAGGGTPLTTSGGRRARGGPGLAPVRPTPAPEGSAQVLAPVVVEVLARLHAGSIDLATAAGAASVRRSIRAALEPAATGTAPTTWGAGPPGPLHEPVSALAPAGVPLSVGPSALPGGQTEGPTSSPSATPATVHPPGSVTAPRARRERGIAGPGAADAALQGAPTDPPPAGVAGHGPRLVATQLGGAFYLLDLLARLDLPASADGPGEPGPRLTRWRVLGLVVRAWGADPDDPLLALLDELGGPPPDERSRPWTYRRPEVARAWLGGAAGAGVDGEVATDGVAGDGPAARWGAQVASLLRSLLGRVDLDEGMVAVAAVVEVGELTLRVRLRLDDVDLRVRRAGLDRDPGWVPALGRVVELSFT